MLITEIRDSVRVLPWHEKFGLLQFLVDELAREEKDILHHIDPECQHGLWSQHYAFGAAEKLQQLLDNNKT